LQKAITVTNMWRQSGNDRERPSCSLSRAIGTWSKGFTRCPIGRAGRSRRPLRFTRCANADEPALTVSSRAYRSLPEPTRLTKPQKGSN